MSLLPHVYSAAADAVRTGEPLARPMPLDHPDRPDAHAADLRSLLGPDLLVAPPYAPGGRRQVRFPPGEWLPHGGGSPITGPTRHRADAPLTTAPSGYEPEPSSSPPPTPTATEPSSPPTSPTTTT